MFFGQRVQVGDALDQAGVEQLHGHRIAQAFDVHDPAMREVRERLRQPCRAVNVDAVGVDLAFDVFGGRVTDRAMGGHLEDTGSLGMLGVDDDLGNVRDNIPCALHPDPASGTNAQSGDFVGIEQADICDGGATDDHRNQNRKRCELAGTAHGDLDLANLRNAGARRELVRDRPPRMTAGIAEAHLRLLRVDLDDYAVDFVAEVVALLLDPGKKGENLIDGGVGVAMGIDAEAKCCQRLQRGVLAGGVVFAIEEQEVGVEIEAALGDGFGVEGAKGACGKVARVGGGGETGGDTFFVGFFEGGQGHDHFTSHLKTLAGWADAFGGVNAGFAEF